MKNEHERLRQLFRQYLENDITAAEQEVFWQLLEKGAAENILDDELKALWESAAKEKALITDQEWEGKLQRLQAAVGQHQEIVSLPDITPQHRWWRTWQAAAALVLLLGGGLLALILFRPAAPLQHIAANGQAADYTGHQVINLPDGSRVIMNTGSKLHYPSKFNDSTRDVYLTGEAYFDIAPVASKPFLVHAGDITTRVLGTTFNVRAYPGDPVITVAVTSGKVQVSTKEKDLGVLLPNEQVKYDKQDNAITKIKADLSPVVAWKEADLVLDSVTLGEAAVIIGNKYHVEIHFAREALKQCRLTATFFSQHGIDHVLNVLCQLSNVSYRKEGETIFIDGAGCN